MAILSTITFSFIYFLVQRITVNHEKTRRIIQNWISDSIETTAYSSIVDKNFNGIFQPSYY
jgi:hypothetical protein